MIGPVDSSKIPRYAGPATFARLPRLDQVAHADVAVVGVPFDTGVSYRPGARFAPSAVREASRLLRPYNPGLDVSPFERLQVADGGDIAVNPFHIGEAIETIEGAASELQQGGTRLVTIGGDHTIALPLLRAAARIHGPVALLHFDAHLDTWDTYFGEPYTHGTPFRRAVEDGILDTEAISHVGTRGPLYGKKDLEDDRRLGFGIVTSVGRDAPGCRRDRGRVAAADRVAAVVRVDRHRRARPGARARHRDARGRRHDLA